MAAMDDYLSWLNENTTPNSQMRGSGFSGVIGGVEKAVNKSIMPGSYRQTMGVNDSSTDKSNAWVGANIMQPLNFNNDWVKSGFGGGGSGPSASNIGMAVTTPTMSAIQDALRTGVPLTDMNLYGIMGSNGADVMGNLDYNNFVMGHPLTALRNTGIGVGGSLARKYLSDLLTEAMKSGSTSTSGASGLLSGSEAMTGADMSSLGGAAGSSLGSAAGVPGAAVGLGMDAATGELQKNPGRSVGSGVGTAVGAGVGTIFGPIGTMAGGMIGNKVGGTIGNVIERGDVMGGLKELSKPPEMNPMEFFNVFGKFFN